MQKSLIVAPQSEPAEVALNVLKSGGNAFDAAIAGALAQGIVDPHRSGIGGFGAAIIYSSKDNKAYCVNFFGRVGSKAKPDMWNNVLEGAAPDGFGYILRGKDNDVGYKSITIPGTVAGFGEIHKRFGYMDWKDLFDGAIGLAQEGFTVSPGMANFWRRPGLFGRVSTKERLGYTSSGSKIWLPEGEPYKAGDRPKQQELANTYKWLAKAGPDDFYKGDLAKQIIKDFNENGALITENDLRNYKCDWLTPLKGNFLGNEILSTPLPGGGLALLQTLRMAELFNILSYPLNSSNYVNALARIFSSVQKDRMSFHSDPIFSRPDIKKLLSDEYLKSIIKDLNPKNSLEPKDTTVIAASDRDGNAIALCHSLGYGSGVYTKNLGFMYNNCMSGFDPVPNNPNSIAPGKARSTAIAQTLILNNGKPKLILGSPGGSHITAGLAQAIINYFHFKMDLQDAVCRPRFDAYRNTLLLESRIPYTLDNELSDTWEILRSPSPFGMVGRIYAIAFTENGPKPGYDPGEAATALEL
ncbi:MAG: gamma-glutamyltransferase [Bacteroidales bacterium]|nr:gamma-glutamyltransferase [Bacteroidales bacterium]